MFWMFKGIGGLLGITSVGVALSNMSSNMSTFKGKGVYVIVFGIPEFTNCVSLYIRMYGLSILLCVHLSFLMDLS